MPIDDERAHAQRAEIEGDGSDLPPNTRERQKPRHGVLDRTTSQEGEIEAPASRFDDAGRSDEMDGFVGRMGHILDDGGESCRIDVRQFVPGRQAGMKLEVSCVRYRV